MSMTRYWIGVASRDHVLMAMRGGFCQLNHGKQSAVKRLSVEDRILYYSPRPEMRSGEPLQAFTAIGEVLAGDPYQVTQSEHFQPFRRNVRYFKACEAPIRPLLPLLSFARGKPSWGQMMRRGTFLIDKDDYQIIADAMRVDDKAAM